MATLTGEQKLFVVTRLACFKKPSAIQAEWPRKWGAPPSLPALSIYDPTTATGRELSQELREAFFATREDFLTRVSEIPIAQQVRRIAALSDRWERMQQVIEARAEEHADVPGGATGLLLRQEKVIGQGEGARCVVEYAVDTGLLKELRGHEEQAAREMGGSYTNVRQLTILQALAQEVADMSDDELRDAAALGSGSHDPASAGGGGGAAARDPAGERAGSGTAAPGE